MAAAGAAGLRRPPGRNAHRQAGDDRAQHQRPACIDIVFEDDTDSPFALSLDRRQVDRSLANGGNILFTVWTPIGKQLTLYADIRGI